MSSVIQEIRNVMIARVENFLKKEGIKYNDVWNYELPFLHSSYTHETPWDDESYERLEFLGDSILGKIVSEHLYLEYPNYDQGDMTLVKHYVVNKEFLANVGRELELHKVLELGQGEDRNNLSDSVFEDVFEALVGAIYLDAGTDEINKFISKHITSKIPNISLNDVKDPKTRLQELLQSETRKSVTYDTDGRPDENKLFSSRAMFDGQAMGSGKGSSKKEAEKAAAKDAIERMV